MSSQVPVWVPLVVALLGVLGVIGGQVINAWREDRRWQREQQREELRWQRQKLSENAKLRIEHAHQWREMKVKIYGELIALLQRYTSLTATFAVMAEVKPDNMEPEMERLSKEVQSVVRDIAKTVGEVTLIGSHELVKQIPNVRNTLVAFGGIRGTYEVSDVAFKNDMVSLGKEISASIESIRAIARSELAVSDIEIDDEASAAPWVAR